MKNGMRNVIATAVVALLTVSLSSGALAAPLFTSKGFRLPTVKHRPVETPEPVVEEPTEAPVETPAPQDDIPATESVAAVVAIEDGALNVYAHADEASEPVAKLNDGDSVTILGRDGDWARVRLADDKEGYAMLQYLSIEMPTEEPVVEPTEEPAVESTEEPVVEPTEEPTVAPTIRPVRDLVVSQQDEETDEQPVAEQVPAEELRYVVPVLNEGEAELALYADADSASQILVMIPAGEILNAKEVSAEWSYVVYGEFAGYVPTSKIALFNDTVTTPEEEEIIRTITIASNLDASETVYEGTEITLTAKLTGFENDHYRLQWQYTPDGGSTIHDIEGANDSQYVFTINDENADYLWRVSVIILVPEAEAAAE